MLWVEYTHVECTCCTLLFWSRVPSFRHYLATSKSLNSLILAQGDAQLIIFLILSPCGLAALGWWNRSHPGPVRCHRPFPPQCSCHRLRSIYTHPATVGLPQPSLPIPRPMKTANTLSVASISCSSTSVSHGHVSHFMGRSHNSRNHFTATEVSSQTVCSHICSPSPSTATIICVCRGFTQSVSLIRIAQVILLYPRKKMRGVLWNGVCVQVSLLSLL